MGTKSAISSHTKFHFYQKDLFCTTYLRHPSVQFIWRQRKAGSSEWSPQSLSKSQYHCLEMHFPFLQLNSLSSSHGRLSVCETVLKIALQHLSQIQTFEKWGITTFTFLKRKCSSSYPFLLNNCSGPTTVSELLKFCITCQFSFSLCFYVMPSKEISVKGLVPKLNNIFKFGRKKNTYDSLLHLIHHGNLCPHHTSRLCWCTCQYLYTWIVAQYIPADSCFHQICQEKYTFTRW